MRAFIFVFLMAYAVVVLGQDKVRYRWDKYSSEYGDLDLPNKGEIQTASIIADLNGNGISDFVIVEKTESPSVVYYSVKEDKKSWDKFIIERRKLDAGEAIAVADIDGDGDIDLAVGSEDTNEIYWWENPAPDNDNAWRRRFIKRTGEPLHKDMAFGDFDNDGKQELAFWNQGDNALFVAQIPDEVVKAKEWPIEKIYTYSTDGQMFQHSNGSERIKCGVNFHSGMDVFDVDMDGVVDILAGGAWFKYSENGYQMNLVDMSYVGARIACGQIIPGGRPEVVMVSGDGVGPVMMYRYEDGVWLSEVIEESSKRAHTLKILDFDQDGFNDIFIAEMNTREVRTPRTFILLNDGTGRFNWVDVGTLGSHNGSIGDIDGDGDYDVVSKPYNWDTPRIDLWINQGKRLK